MHGMHRIPTGENVFLVYESHIHKNIAFELLYYLPLSFRALFVRPIYSVTCFSLTVGLYFLIFSVTEREYTKNK